MIDVRERISVGRNRLQVTRLGLGSAALGFLYTPVVEQEARMVVKRAYEMGVRFFDTAPLYGNGIAERRLGVELSHLPRASYVLASKVGYALPTDSPPSTNGLPESTLPEPPRDYSYDGVMRCIEGSLKRLGAERLDIIHIHDPDEHFGEAMEGAYRALDTLRSQGVIGAIGVGMNQAEMLARFAHAGDFDCFLLAGRYTLLDQRGLAELLPLCVRRQISVFIGGPFNSGLLADPYAAVTTFNYKPAAQEWTMRAQRIDVMCQRYEVPLKAAALQFPLAHPTVAAVLTGARSTRELEENARMLRYPIPADLWANLKAEGLLAQDAPTPAPSSG